MKRAPAVVVAATLMAVLACTPTINVPHVDTGPTETVTVNEPLPAEGVVAHVAIEMGGGSLELAAGAPGLADGTVQYNVAAWRPTITRTDGDLRIVQGNPDPNLVLGEDTVNQWNLRLGATPMDLSIHAGAYSGQLDLTGLPLQRLEIQDGASNTRVTFSAPNPAEMEDLSYTTGASTVDLIGLGFANIAEMSFEGGAGTYTLDFSGGLQRDADVTVHAGVSSIRLQVPSGTPAQVTVGGALRDVTTIGAWTSSGDRYEAAGSGPTLTVRVDMGLGSLTLAVE
jgi:hypothetical protein